MHLREFLGGISKRKGERMPSLFIGHGNPMNTIADNQYSEAWKTIGEELPPPQAILTISAHWLTPGKTLVTASEKPKTLHDFMGFPQELFQQQYPAPGAVVQAKETIKGVENFEITEDLEWGYDHGTWSILLNMYPKANIPVYQLSIDYGKPLEWHLDLAKELKFLRDRGVLVIGSGNVVHNLRMMNFHAEEPYEWAIEFDDFVRASIEDRDANSLVQYHKLGELARVAHPTNDHYLPLIYSMGTVEDKEDIVFFTNSFDLASVSMRSFISY